MSNQYSGGLITKTPTTPNSISAPGVWTLSQQAAAQATNSWPFPRDAQFNYVTMLLQGNGSGGPTSNGAGAGASPTVTPFNSDASTNNFNVTINGDARSNNFNPYQAGYYSNYFGANSSNRISAPADAAFAFGTAAFTVEAWIYVFDLSQENFVFDTRSSVSTAGVGFSIEPSTGKLRYSGNANNVLTTTAITANTWNHVAWVYNGTTLTGYINGVSGGTATPSFNITQNNGQIGNVPFSSVSTSAFLSNVRVVKGTAVYTGTFTPSTTPLTAISGTSLLTCQSNRFVDNSSNAFTLTISGSPQVSPAQPFTLPSSVATYGSGYFDGSGDYLSTADNAVFDFGSGNFTIETWANFSSASQEHIVVSQWPGASNRAWVIAVDASAGSILFAYTTNGTTQINVSVSFAFKASTWYHLAVCRDSTNLRIFVNGAVLTTYNISTNTIYNSSASILIGAFESGSIPLFGYVSDFRIVKGTAVYTEAFTPPTAPLTAITNTSLLTTQYNGGGNNSGFKDSSQNNFPITRFGNTSQGTFTPYGSNWSNYFGGAGSHLAGPSNAVFATGTNSFTIEGWVFLTASSYGSIISTWNSTSGTNGVILGVTVTNYVQFSIGNGGGSSDDVLSSSTIPLNTWTHIAGVRNGSALTIYVNGVSAGTGTTTRSITQQVPYIGAYYANTPTSYSITGYVSNVRFTSSAVYTSAFTPSTTPLTAITNTQLLTCQSNRFVDNSTNAFYLTITGTPSVQRFSPFSPTTAYSTSVMGGSGYFDGSSDYLRVPSGSVSLSGDFTVEGWVYRTSSSGNGYILLNLGNDYYSTAATFIIDVSGYLRVYTGQAHLLAGTTGVVQLNSWNHVAFVRSSNTLKAYLNGVQVDTASWSASLSGTAYINLEANGYPTQNLYPGSAGYYSNIRVGTTAVYTTAFTPSTTPLTAITGTQLLLNFTNAGILDNAMMNDLETVGNAQISTSVKKYGTGSIYFDGTGDWLYTPSTPNLAFGSGDFTIEFWLYLATLPSSGNFYSVYDNRPAAQGAYPLIYVDNTTGTLKYWVSSADRITGSNLSATTWYHIAVSRASGSTKMFVNGTQVGSTYADTTTYLQSYLTIGTNSLNTSLNNLNGYIDDLRITKGVARYTANFTVPDQAFKLG